MCVCVKSDPLSSSPASKCMGPWCLMASTPPRLCCCTSEVFQGSRDDWEDLEKQKGSEKLEGVQYVAH